jgi:glycosyltransferase involved in cell wall biosynthesis
MNLAYITAQIPWGGGEVFLIDEMLSLKKQTNKLLIIPRNPPKKLFHKDAKSLLDNAVWLPLLSFEIFVSFLGFLFTKDFFWVCTNILLRSRNFLIFIKNLAVIPKAFFLTKVIRKRNIQHIHAHWGGTTSTMALLISHVLDIEWSLTLHRWDIKENNLLEEKIKSAKFTRCISNHGKKELIDIVGNNYMDKIKIIHMGVQVEKCKIKEKKDKKIFNIIVPARLVKVKGHKYLIEACDILVRNNIKNFQCIFYGEGPQKSKLKKMISPLLKSYVYIRNKVSHGDLMLQYRNGEVDLVVLPSILTKNNIHEGIPVSLMEAMQFGVPVLSTKTGGIPELLTNGAGIIVNERSAEELASSIIKLIKNKKLREEIGENEKRIIFERFNVEKNTEILLKEIKR